MNKTLTMNLQSLVSIVDEMLFIKCYLLDRWREFRRGFRPLEGKIFKGSPLESMVRLAIQ